MKTLREFQLAAVDRMIRHAGFILADECGLGKTVTSIEAVKCSRTNPSCWMGLVVCPPSLCEQWKEALLEQDPAMYVVINNHIHWDFAKVQGWVVVSYYELLHKTLNQNIQSVLWDVVIVDEAHRIKNRKTKTSKAVRSLLKARGYALTGTPMETSPADLWSLLNFICPDDFPAYWAFVNGWLTKEPDYFEHFKYGGPLNHDEFGDMLHSYMLRRTKIEVAPELPEKIIVHERVAMDDVQKKAYKELSSSDDIQVTIQDQEFLIPNVLAAITKAQQISTDPGLIGLFNIGSGKLEWLNDFITDHQGEPMVIFSRFRDVMIRLAGLYHGACVVGGSERNDKDFTRGLTNYLFGTIDAMGEGLNLQRAKYAIFLDGHWSATKMTQAMDRIHRMDITEPKVIYLLDSCREDRLTYKAVEDKWSEADLVYHYLND